MKLKLPAAIFVLFTVIQVTPALSDPTLEQAREGAQVQKMLDIAEEIQLDKKQEKVFWRLYNNYQADIQNLGDKRIKLIEDAKRAHTGLTDAQASDLIRRALALEEARLATKRRHVGLFLEKLPPRIVARYFQLENKIQSQVDSQIAERMPLVGE